MSFGVLPPDSELRACHFEQWLESCESRKPEVPDFVEGTYMNKSAAVSRAENLDASRGLPIPSTEQTKAIAEEGFIYGLPIVLNYAVMNE
jgi:hypothetical protein